MIPFLGLLVGSFVLIGLFADSLNWRVLALIAGIAVFVPGLFFLTW